MCKLWSTMLTQVVGALTNMSAESLALDVWTDDSDSDSSFASTLKHTIDALGEEFKLVLPTPVPDSENAEATDAAAAAAGDGNAKQGTTEGDKSYEWSLCVMSMTT